MIDPATSLKLRRLGSAMIDIILIPALVGVLMGLLLHNMAEAESTKYLRAVSVAFAVLLQRDFIYSPGRHLLGLHLVDTKKGNLICFYQGNIFLNLLKSTVRNILLFIPFVLVVGYILEAVMVVWKGNRLMDLVAGVKVVDKTEKVTGPQTLLP